MSESIPNLGVVPLASKEAHMAALAEIQASPDLSPAEPADLGPVEQDLGPVEPAQEPVSLTAYKAARGPAPEQAAKALQLAKGRGFSPQFAAENLDTIQQAQEQSGFEDALGVSPILAAYAAKSGVHASAVKDDVSVLQALEMGLSDVGYAVTARKYMDDPSKVDAGGLAAYEGAAADFAARQEAVQDPIDRIAIETARALPNVAAYGASSVLGAVFAKGGGTALGLGTALYQLNRGVLYRRILAQAPVPTAQERELAAGRDVSDAEFAQWTKERQDFETRAKEYAKKGALTGATIGAVLGDAFTRALPFANQALRQIGDEIASKAAAETLAQSAAERGSELAGHTLSGAMLMAEQAVVDDATVQKATTGKIDVGKAVEAGKDAFLGGLAVSAVLSAYTPGREFLRDLGRIREAALDASRLDAMVEQANASKLRSRAPAEFERMTGEMAASGDTPAVYINGETVAADPKLAAAVTSALADSGQAVAEAQATAGDVAVPTEKYLGQIAPDFHETVREDVKLQVNGFTPRDATERQNAISKLLAERSMVLKDVPEGPEQRKQLQAVHEKMRDAMVGIYGGTPQEWAQAAPPAVTDTVARALATEPQEKSAVRAAAMRALAKETVESKPIAEIHPGRYAYAAARIAQKAIDFAIASIQKGSRDTLVITPHRPTGEVARYELVEAKNLIPSHKAETFTPNEAYPEGVQERFYQGQPEEQLKVTQGGAHLNPALLLTNTPSPLDGPPIVTSGERRLVLGGNGRTMMIQRAFADEAVRDRYKAELVKRAGEFGLTPEDVQKMKAPVLVRELPGITHDAAKAELIGATRRFNEGLTQQLSPRARALAEARTLTQETLDSLGALLFDSGDASLRDVLRDRPREVLDILRRDGVINAQNQPQWLSGDTLTADAKSRIEGMFIGRIVENETRLNATTPDILNKVERAAPYLLRVAGVNPALDETGTVRRAIDLLNAARAKDLKLKDALAQGVLFGQSDPAVLGVAEMLATASPREVASRFKAWSTYAAVDPRQTGMFGTTPTLPESLGRLLEQKPAAFQDYVRPAVEPEAPDNTAAIAAKVRSVGLGETKPTKPKASPGETLQTLQAQHVQAHAMETAAREVRAEMDRTKAFLEKVDNEKTLAQLGKADPAYADAFNTIMDAIDPNTPRSPPRPEALEALLSRMDRDAEPVGFDAEGLRKILSNPMGWNKLTPPEARTVQDAVRNIRAAARRVTEIELADRKATLREFVTEARSFLDQTGVPDSGPPAPSRASAGFPERLGNVASTIHAENLHPREILRRLGPNGEAIYDAFVRARNGKDELARQVGAEVWKMYDQGLPKELKKSRFDSVKGPGSPAFADNLWTRQDLWEFASWWGSESGSDRIKRGLRITDGQAHDFLSQLTNAEADFLEAKWKLNDEKIWPLIRDHERSVTGTTPPKIEARPFTIRTAEGDIRELRGGYEPARYRTDAESTVPAPENAQTISDYWGSLRNGFPSTARYFLKERLQNVSRLPDLNWSTYSSHVGSVLHYLSHDDFVRNVGRVFRDPEFRELVQRRLGPQYMTELDKFLGVAARGRVETAQDGARELSRIIGSGFRSRVATAAFQLNPRVILGQLSHIPAAKFALQIPVKNVLEGVASAMRPWTWGDAHGESEQLPYRWNGFGSKMREQLQGIGPGDKPYAKKWLDAAGWSAYHAMDGFLSKAIFEMGKSKALDAGADPVAAAKAGDKAVAVMMQPLNLAEQSSFARDRGVIGSLILVRNFPNTLYNVGAKLEWDARNQVFAADPGWQKAKVALGAYGAAGASYLGTVWAAHILGRLLMGHGRQPDEKTSEWLEREALSAPFYPVPLVSDVAGAVSEAAVTRKTLRQATQHHGIAAAPAIAEIERAIRDLGTVLDDKNPEQRVFAGLRLTANVLNLPSEPLRGVQYGYDLATGSTTPRGPLDVAGGFFYGKRRRQARNPATLAQDFLSGD